VANETRWQKTRVFIPAIWSLFCRAFRTFPLMDLANLVILSRLELGGLILPLCMNSEPSYLVVTGEVCWKTLSGERSYGSTN